MTVKELKDILDCYTDDVEVMVYRLADDSARKILGCSDVGFEDESEEEEEEPVYNLRGDEVTEVLLIHVEQ